MDAVVTRALRRAATVVATALMFVTAVLLVDAAGRRASAADVRDLTAICAVVTVAEDRDEVRAGLAKTSACAQERLAVHLRSGATVGSGRATSDDVAAVAGWHARGGWVVVPDKAVVELSDAASAVYGSLLWQLLSLGLVGATACFVAVRIGRRARLRWAGCAR
ncbi:hypothetical protein [Lentzea flava]|uniref:Transmembrane protein n=1 Tax=Lentzea flava TaxID=103732 RepID=A0ABQ2VK93_9PSEU|nr:hypothetical protein [Lentzea flava]MCP2205537.1 hypothetical protein [Lentzea flava]GGU87939.1 hypothetical protein GCM10010178_92010 [Lentzea flava]